MNSPHLSDIGWSTNPRLWKELDNLGKNLSWKNVNLDLSKKHLLPGNYRGVYLICAFSPSKTLDLIKAYTILYAGKVTSSNRGLRNRFIEHINHPNSILKEFLHCYYPKIDFWYAIINEQSQIDEMEAILIETFKPPCNKIRAPGTQILLARLGPGKVIGTRRER